MLGVSAGWFILRQQPDGLWKEQRLWINLAVCRVFKRFYAGTFQSSGG
jgi:hypothetical protein